jgi:predicted transcriptional regulator
MAVWRIKAVAGNDKKNKGNQMTRDPKLDLAFATVMRRIKTETGSTYGEIAEDAGINSVTVRNYCRRAPEAIHVIANMMDFFGDGIGDFFAAVEAEHEKNR